MKIILTLLLCVSVGAFVNAQEHRSITVNENVMECLKNKGADCYIEGLAQSEGIVNRMKVLITRELGDLTALKNADTEFEQYKSSQLKLSSVFEGADINQIQYQIYNLHASILENYYSLLIKNGK
jgi:hypothetical protein